MGPRLKAAAQSVSSKTSWVARNSRRWLPDQGLVEPVVGPLMKEATSARLAVVSGALGLGEFDQLLALDGQGVVGLRVSSREGVVLCLGRQGLARDPVGHVGYPEAAKLGQRLEQRGLAVHLSNAAGAQIFGGRATRCDRLP